MSSNEELGGPFIAFLISFIAMSHSVLCTPSALSSTRKRRKNRQRKVVALFEQIYIVLKITIIYESLTVSQASGNQENIYYCFNTMTS